MAFKLSKEYNKTLLLAYPVMLGQTGHVVVGMVDSMMVGKLGVIPLAASALANSVFFLFFVFGLGASYAVTPLVANADGERNIKKISELLAHAIVINLLMGIVLYGLAEILALFIGNFDQPVEVVDAAIPYLSVITLSMIPLMLYQSFKQFAEGLSDTKMAMVITLTSNALNIFLNYVLIFGKFGFEPMGLVGAGWATFIARSIMAVWMALYVLYNKRFEAYTKLLNFKELSIATTKKILGIGIPSALQFTFEVTAFIVATFFMGMISAEAQAAHQIAIVLASFSYMLASGLGAAATVRVGNQLGRKDYKMMRTVGFISFKMSVVLMTFMGLVFVIGRYFFPTLFNDDVEVVNIAASLLFIAVLFQISDGVQVVGMGALRGMSDVKIPMYIALFSYWVIGLPVAWLLGFTLNFGPEGIWYGLALGLTCSAVFLSWRFHKLSSLNENEQLSHIQE